MICLLYLLEKFVQGEVMTEFVKSPRDGNKVFFSIEMFEQVWSVFGGGGVREWCSARVHCYSRGTRRTGLEKMCYRAKEDGGFLDRSSSEGSEAHFHDGPMVGRCLMVWVELHWRRWGRRARKVRLVGPTQQGARQRCG